MSHGRLVTLLAVVALGGLGLVPAAEAGTATDEMVACAALGNKRPGTEADRRMSDHLIGRFRGAGLETTAEEFHMPVWKAGTTVLELDGKAYRAQAFPYSGTGTVDAPIVDGGNGMPGDLDAADIKGKVVLVDSGGTYHRTVQLENIMARGGAAMVFVSASPKDLIQTGAVRWGQRPPAAIPSVSVGSETGAALRAQLAAGARTASLTVQGERVDTVTRNVVGVRKGTTYPDRYIVVAGHYDSWYAGANDNCSAIGTLLAMVDDQRDQAPAYTTIYLGWGAEEPGLVGSYEWIREHQDLIPRTVLNINLEETASATFQGADPTALPSVVLSFGSSTPALTAAVTAAAAPNVVLPPVLVPMAATRSQTGGIIPTDIEGFYAQGVQGVSTASSSPYYHTTHDTSDKINVADLERVTTYLETLLRVVQPLPPAALQLREVPQVTVSAPRTAPPGAAVPVDITVTDPLGRGIAGDRVLVLADQRDNWAVAESVAEDLGGGRYRWTLPAGATDADITDIRATTSTTAYLANGFARIDQRAGGVLPATGATSACRSRRVLTLHARRGVTGLRATTSRGKVRVRGRTVRLDLRGVARGDVTVRLTGRSAAGRTVRQTRVFRTCARRA